MKESFPGYWRESLPDASEASDSIVPLMDAPVGTLRRVLALGQAAVSGGERVELLSLEIYDSGAILRFRAGYDSRPDGDQHDRTPVSERWQGAHCESRDDLGTAYETASGGGGDDRVWRGEVLIKPTPPATAITLSVELVPRNNKWAFDVSLG